MVDMQRFAPWVGLLVCFGLVVSSPAGAQDGGELKAPLALLGPAPELPEIFAEHGLGFGMPVEEALKTGLRGGAAAGDKDLEGYPRGTKIGYTAQSSGTTGIWGLKLAFATPPDELLPVLTERWGQPSLVVEAKYTSWEKQVVWLNPEQRIRARLAEGRFGIKTCQVIFDRYVPLADFLGEAPATALAFETKPLLGLTGEEVKAAHPDGLVPNYAWKDGSPSRIDIVPTEYQLKPLQVFLFYDRETGKLNQYGVKFDIQSTETARDETLKAIQARYGEPVGMAPGNRVVYQEEPLRVEVDVESNPREVVLYLQGKK